MSRRSIGIATVILLTYVALLIVGGTVLAAECTTPMAEIKAKAATDGARVIQVDDSRMIAAFTAVYNAQPPESHDTFAAVYLFGLPNGVTVISFANNDALCGSMTAPTPVIDKLLQRMMGVAL